MSYSQLKADIDISIVNHHVKITDWFKNVLEILSNEEDEDCIFNAMEAIKNYLNKLQY